jgi:hypothetical protein
MTGSSKFGISEGEGPGRVKLVYRRRFTGRLWNTTSCLTVAPLTLAPSLWVAARAVDGCAHEHDGAHPVRRRGVQPPLRPAAHALVHAARVACVPAVVQLEGGAWSPAASRVTCRHVWPVFPWS